MAVAYATLNLTDLIGTASARIATCLVCKELFALRMVSKATLKNTNEQIEQLVKRLWFDGPLKQEMDDPGSSRSEGVEVSASEDHSVLNSDIFLNIYDVTKSEGVQWVNGLFANQYSPIKLGGLFHIGVRIDDRNGPMGTLQTAQVSSGPRRSLMQPTIFVRASACRRPGCRRAESIV
jgi:hypothetical protein